MVAIKRNSLAKKKKLGSGGHFIFIIIFLNQFLFKYMHYLEN